MSREQFIQLFSTPHNKLSKVFHFFTTTLPSQNTLFNLYDYFNNNRTKSELSLSLFIQKYCILVKANHEHFSQIVHLIYCKNVETEAMQLLEFERFQEQNADYILREDAVEQLPLQKFPMRWQQFYQTASKSMDWSQLQMQFQIIRSDDIPFQKISQQIQRLSSTDSYEKGQTYYVFSSEWFNKWTYFYEFEEESELVKNSHIRSQKNSKKVRRGSFSTQRHNQNLKAQRKNSSKLIGLGAENTAMDILQPPTEIDFQDIEGEFYGELKEFLSVERSLTIIGHDLWTMLKKLHETEFEFERKAISKETVELYPVSIYFYDFGIKEQKAGTKKQYSEKRIIRISASSSIEQMLRYLDEIEYALENEPSQQKQKSQEQNASQSGYKYFWTDFKDSGSSNNQKSKSIDEFRKLQAVMERSAMTVQQLFPDRLRIIVFRTLPSSTVEQNRLTQFLTRQAVTKQNLTMGDKIDAYFSYQDKFCPAFVIGIRDGGVKTAPEICEYKVHFIGFSYRYEKWVRKSMIRLIQTSSQVFKSLVSFTKQQMFEGLDNIGNTCFINAVVQALASTPIFYKYLLNKNFTEKNQPLSYVLGKTFKGLHNKQKFSIQQMKRTINRQMPMFSGYDQHDSQEFLNLLLDKMEDEVHPKPTIIDELFGGEMQSKFTCLKCQECKRKPQKIHSISLPVPEPEYNIFAVLIIPIYQSKISKIVLRLHKNAKVNEYLSEIESRSKIKRQDFIYVETELQRMKKFKNELAYELSWSKKVNDIVLTKGEIWAFQKIKNSTFEQRISLKLPQVSQSSITEGCFYDFYISEETAWFISKVVHITEDSIEIECLKQNNAIVSLKVSKTEQVLESFHKLGTKLIERPSKKLCMRKFSSSMEQMIKFGRDFLITIPRWASYNDIIHLVEEYISNMTVKKSEADEIFNPIAASKKSIVKNSTFIYLDEIESNENHELKMTPFKMSRNDNYEEIQPLNSLSNSKKESNVSLKQIQQNSNGNNETVTPLKQKSSQFSNSTAKNPFIIKFLQPTSNNCFVCGQELEQFSSPDQIRPCCEPTKPEDRDIPLHWVGKEKFFYFIIDWVDLSFYNENFCSDVHMDNLSILTESKKGTDIVTLQQCLDLFQQPEHIEMECEKCHFHEHLLETHITKAPLITVLHLKQFKYTSEGQFMKIDINLKWNDTINLQKYCSDTVNQNLNYEKFAVIEHKGSTNFGHYTAITKRRHPYEKRKVWVNFDDESTSIMDELPQSVENAYLLFFKRINVPSSAIVNFSI